MIDPAFLEALPAWLTAALPRTAIAAILVVVGWLVAFVLGRLTRRVVRRVADVVLLRTSGRRLEDAGVERVAVDLLGTTLFWAVFVLFVAAASDLLGVTVLTLVLQDVAQYVPNLAAALLLVVGGIVVGNLAASTVRSAALDAGMTTADGLGRLSRGVVLVAAALLALDQIGIEISVLLLVLGAAMATVVGGGALAFGLGARDTVKSYLTARELHRTYRVGDRVRLGDVQGRVVQLTRTAVVLETAEGPTRVPASLFDAQPSVLIPDPPHGR